MTADHPSVHATTVAQWRRWLRDNHDTADGVWLIHWRPGTGKPRLSYEDSIPEALAYGWIDSVHRPLDSKRTALHFTRRRPGGGWSRVNKARIARLVREGRMQRAGRAAIATAKRDGTWSMLDGVEALAVPADLRRALGTRGVRAFNALSRGAKKGHLRTLVTAKRPETRVKRLAAIAAALRG